VMAKEDGDFLGVWERAQALNAWAGRPELSALALAFSRVHNITKGQEAQGFDPTLFVEEAEKKLWHAYQEVKPVVEGALAAHRYAEALDVLLSLKFPIDRYFDEVLVMCEDGRIRANRLGFLRELSGLFLRLADLSRLVVPG
ncbi:MAG: DALR anticodon-binding domain-containing protein, partial [Candidatus Bipolaricaulaceae bacterium]